MDYFQSWICTENVDDQAFPPTMFLWYKGDTFFNIKQEGKAKQYKTFPKKHIVFQVSMDMELHLT